MGTLAANLSIVLNILKVVLGLGFVIFLHELGHFLAAKWAGVKVEKFFLGFDPYGLRVATFTYGETTYGIGAIPLGGYVKMLGEDPGEEGEEKTSDPRAFSNKSVGARMVILSAGVAMNVLLGLTVFTITQMLGVEEVPARLGAVQAGGPAYEAGLRPGDEIVAIDGRGDVHFQRLKLKVSLSGPKQELKFTVKRPGVPELLTIAVSPKREATASMPMIGIAESRSLTLFKKKPFEPLPGSDGPAPRPDDLPGGGTIIEAGPAGGTLVPVGDVFALNRVLTENRAAAVDLTVESPTDPETKSAPRRTRATLPMTRVLSLGLRMTTGPVVAIQANSIGEKAGFRKGDRIVKVEGSDDLDPIRLPDDLFARAGKSTRIVIERQDEGNSRTIELTVTPDSSPPWSEPVISTTAPLKLPGLGLAIEVEPKVAAVVEGSPAARHGVKPGAVLQEISIPPDSDEPKGKPVRHVFEAQASPKKDTTRASWNYVSWLLQNIAKRELALTFAGSATPVLLTPEPDLTWSNPLRGLNLMPLFVEVPPQPFPIALKRGWDETYDNVVSIYAMIRSLFQGLVSPKNLAGLPRIANIAYQTASMGLVPLLQFLGVISINLAVLNFLPIPPLDGGQIAFLIAEKIRGKPLPETTLVIFMIGGLALVGCLMLYTVIQDIVLMITG